MNAVTYDHSRHVDTLSCRLAYCTKCLTNLSKTTGDMKCPECRAHIVPLDYHVCNLGAASSTNGRYDFAEDHASAIEGPTSCSAYHRKAFKQLCVDCGLNLRESCCTAHKIVPATTVPKYGYKQTQAIHRLGTHSVSHVDELHKSRCASCNVPIDYRAPRRNHLCSGDVMHRVMRKLQEKEKECQKSSESVTCELVAMEELYQAEATSVTRHVAENMEKMEKNSDRLLQDLKKEKELKSRYLESEFHRYARKGKDISSTRSLINVLQEYFNNGEIVSKFQKTLSYVDQLDLATDKHTEQDDCVKSRPSLEILECSHGTTTSCNGTIPRISTPACESPNEGFGAEEDLGNPGESVNTVTASMTEPRNKVTHIAGSSTAQFSEHPEDSSVVGANDVDGAGVFEKDLNHQKPTRDLRHQSRASRHLYKLRWDCRRYSVRH
ncbi:uncharacterized protein LOC100372663 [Saccoglossus kowalevskii]|uniref:Uncharacterized protein LOC100372663 n=1 Tax=Saccoglossus kowalevskii TaxID=10224 RepID=A0ABM0GMM8_SACKO|nr:PREDICTED: uncharacterized protein LOC100372663 [Saccoglossus kowalevskii]